MPSRYRARVYTVIYNHVKSVCVLHICIARLFAAWTARTACTISRQPEPARRTHTAARLGTLCRRHLHAHVISTPLGSAVNFSLTQRRELEPQYYAAPDSIKRENLRSGNGIMATSCDCASGHSSTRIHAASSLVTTTASLQAHRAIVDVYHDRRASHRLPAKPT